MNLTYKGKSLVNSSTPGFSLEDAFLQEVWFYLHWCWLVVKVESQNDAHALLYVWDYYSIKLNAVFLLSGEVTCSLRTKGITALCRYSNWRLGSHYSVKTKKKSGSFPFIGGGESLWIQSVCVQSLIFNGQQFEPVLCLLENICVFSEATESESHTGQLKWQVNIFLFRAVKCLINPHKHELC